MSSSDSGAKPAQTGLVDMGNISFYDNGAPATFTISDLANYAGSFSEMVLNVTWAQMQATEGGAINTSAIESAISQVNTYNLQHGTDVGIKLRVWGGFTAPAWAKNIDGAAITITGQNSVDPALFGPQTIGRVWSGDYINAWTSFQNQLAVAYDKNPIIRGISQTLGGAASDEPFVPLKRDAPVSQGSSQTVNQIAELQAGGYNDAAEMLTLRASIADYAQWSATPLDFTMNSFYQFDSGPTVPDANFALAVLQQARNSSHLVQAGNHALRDPLYSFDLSIYGQLSADAALNPAVASNSFQTASPFDFFPTYADWQAAVAAGVTLDAGNIELWDFPTTPTNVGFTGLTPGQVQGLATMLAAGSPPPTAGAPDDGSALGLIAPAFAAGAPGAVAFSGTSAVLLASVTPQAAYRVTLTSLKGGTLGVADLTGAVIGSTSGPTLTLSGSLAAVNTVLAHLTDTLQSGTDIVRISAMDSSGNIVVRNVGVEVTPPAASTTGTTSGLSLADQNFAFGGGTARVVGQDQAGSFDTAAQLGNSGLLIVGGVQSALSLAGNLDLTGSTTLLAALSPSAYSTASLTVGGALEVHGGATARFTGSLGAASITVDAGGAIDAAGTLTATGGGPIVNNDTIEAMSDQTLGLQRLNVASRISGTGSLLIDAGATLRLGAGVASTQTIQFAANSSAQFTNTPYSPSTLVLGLPDQIPGAISGFSFADRLVLEGVAATNVTYSGSTLTVDRAGAPSLSYTLSGDLAFLQRAFTVTGSGSSAQTVISFVAPTGGAAPSVVAPATLRGAVGTAVLVPNVVVMMPLPDPPPVLPSGVPQVTVTLTAVGKLSAGNDNGNTTITGNGTSALVLSGMIDAVERSLQTLTYRAVGSASDSIVIAVSDYTTGVAGGTTITVSNTGPVQFNWTAASGSFADPANWSVGTTPPGGADIATFGPGTRTVSGDGAVGLLSVTGTTTLTGQVAAQGRSGVALTVDSGGALTLAGGALLTAQQQATVGGSGQGLLTVMGGALALTGPSTADALVIGASAGSNGTVLDLEQIKANGTVVVGAAGTGTLELLGVAASVLDGGADIGQSAGAQGSAIVNGGEWTTSGQLTVGDAGTGALLIDGAVNGTTGQATAFNATIGAQAGSEGTVTLDGGELLVANVAAATSTLAVGAGGTGNLVVKNGGEVAVGAAQTTFANSNGVLKVGGTGGGRGRVDLGWFGVMLVNGSSMVGGAAGAGSVIVGDSAGDTALFSTLGTLSIGLTGLVALGGANATVRASAIDIAAGGAVSGAGTISGLGGGNNTAALASIDNESSITAAGGNLLLYGAVTGSGTLAVSTGATMTLQAAVGSGQTLAFSPNARAVLNDARAFKGTITGFGAGDVLDIAGTDASSAVWSDGVLTLNGAFGPIRLFVGGNYASNAFAVQSDGLGGTNVTGGTGDVHMTTFDGLHYDFQAVGDFVAVRSTGSANPWQIQIRTEAANGAASITTELAAVLGDTRVTFAAGGANPVYVDGAPDTALQVGGTQSLAGGTLTRLSSAVWRLTWNTGESVTVAERAGYDHGYLDWGVGLGPQDGPGSIQGLLGSNSGQATDFQLPDGTVLQQPLSDDEILGRFADAWRVAPGGSLFDDGSAPKVAGTSSSLALLLQHMSAMGDATAGAASRDLNATLQGAISPSAGDLFAAATPNSPFHG